MNSEGKVSEPAAREIVTFPILKRLPHDFQGGSMELREFVEEQHTVVCKTHLPGVGWALPPRSPASEIV
jgi:hypothetical protein